MNASLIVVLLVVSQHPSPAGKARTKKADRGAPAASTDAPLASSAELETRGRAAKARGDAAMDAGRPADALAAYTEAWSVWPDPVLLYNRARAFEKLQSFPEALELINQFAQQASPELKSKVPKLMELVQGIQRKTARLHLTCNVAGAEVRLGDRILGTTPLPDSLVVKSESTTLELKAEGYFDWSRKVDLPQGGTLDLEAQLASKKTDGLLRVESVEGTSVFLDNAPPRNVPLEAIVTPGLHRVRLSHEGYSPLDTTVVLNVGELRKVSYPLEPLVPIYRRWYFWAGVAAVVAGGVATTVALTTERQPSEGTLGITRGGLRSP